MYYKKLLKNILVVSLTMVWIWSANIAQVLSCWGSTATNIGVMTPDQKLLDGNELSIDCSLNNNTIEYNKTLFEVNSSQISFKFQTQYYREDRIHIINATTAQLVVRKASVADNGLYLCMLNISGLDHHPLVCVTHVTVGYKPQSVTDFKCISLHYRKLHCSWTPPPNPIPTSYVLEDKLHPNTTLDYLSRKCGHIPADNANSCEWTMDTIPPYRNTALEFNLVLTGENQFGTNSQLFVVNHYSIIKPNTPKNVMTLEVNTNNITLSWKAPEYIEYDEDILDNLIYEIRYFGSIPYPNDDYNSQTVIIDGIHKTSHVLTDLLPYIRYNISIRCKTIQSNSDEYWSEFSSILITTKPDVPRLAPEMIAESYQTDKNMEGLRSITLFWKHIPVEYRNGRDFRYGLESSVDINPFDKSNDIIPIKRPEYFETPNTTFTFNHMKSDFAYDFKLFGVNKEGVSQEFAFIQIQKNNIIPHKPSNIDVYSFGGGRYEVQWTAPRLNSNSGPIVNYTVFWCQNLRPRPFQCEGAIDWIHTNNRSIALELPDIPTNYQFAVSANALFTSSGMSWAECIVPIDGRLDKLSEVHAKVINSTSIDVNWKLSCPAQKRVVEGYKITYCDKSDCSTPEHVMVANSESYVLNGLNPFTKYKITVLAFSDTGPSEESVPIYSTTYFDAPEDAPLDLRVEQKTEHSISIVWKPPMKPNGVLSHYEIFCNGFRFNFDSNNCTFDGCLATIQSLDSYNSHNIRVRACNTASYCSPESKIVAKTLTSAPKRMEPPRSEVINSTSVRISWSRPSVPNGPIDYYSLEQIRADNNSQTFIIPGKQTEYYLPIDCSSSADEVTPYRPQYTVRISAANSRPNASDLVSEYSESTSLNACVFADRNIGYIIGLIAGGGLGLMLVVMVLVALVRWMKRRITSYNSLRIELPKGLEVPQLVTNGYDRDNGDSFSPFGRADSIPNMSSGMVLPVIEDDDPFKNRHGSGMSHTSNSSTEILIYNNQTNDAFFRMASNDSGGQHESVSSHNSGAESAHISSDSGVEIDSHHQNGELNGLQNKVSPKPSLPILDEMSRTSDSSGDSGLDMTSTNGTRSKRKRKPKTNKSNSKISTVMPIRNEVMNPLYDSPLSHSVCIYSLLANSEPSLFDLPFKGEDDNILSDTTKFTKPEMAKSLTNIIQSCSPSDPKVNCIICETNNTSNKGMARTVSPNCPYYKYGIKRQNHIQTNCVTNFLSPEKRDKINVRKTKNGYISIDSILANGQPITSRPKKRLEHDWSQNSYDAEVSSTSSNGDNEHLTDMIPQNHPFLQSSNPLNDCEKIQNNSLVDIEDNSTELNAISHSSVNPLNPSTDNYVIECETQLNAVKEPPKGWPSSRVLAKDSNGYVLHNTLTQLTANPIKPKLVKNSNGYVVLDGNGIEMNDFVPNSNVIHATQV